MASSKAPMMRRTISQQFRAVKARADFVDRNEPLGLFANVPEESP